jgi:hypothetical protein
MDDTLKLCVITASDIPTPAPCCQGAHEKGYRSGYKDGYTYAFCDAGGTLSESIWARFWRFREEVLLPWMRRSWGDHARWERGPRFHTKQTRRQKARTERKDVTDGSHDC